jgi:hypothetical protein
MKTKKLIVTGLITLFTIFTFTTVSWAGSAHKHRMEGLAWGIGAAILGKVIIDHHRNNHPVAAPAPQPAVHYQQAPAEPAGRWEVRREWVPARYKKVWNPGHYNHRGHWVRGHWMKVQIEQGYWQEKEVWVPYY